MLKKQKIHLRIVPEILHVETPVVPPAPPVPEVAPPVPVAQAEVPVAVQEVLRSAVVLPDRYLE